MRRALLLILLAPLIASAQLNGGVNGSAVTQIIAGTNVTLSPSTGVGNVTINALGGGGGGTVTSASVVSANGFSGTVANPTTTPAITLTTSVTGPLKGAANALAAASAADIYGLWSGTCSSSTFLRGDGTCAAPAGGGTVTSVALVDGSTAPIFTISGSPITGSGTLTQTLSVESANLLFAGPTTGAAAQPTFRSLVSGDIPTLNQNTTGTAANLSGTPTLPNGTAAATQTTADNTTKLATDAFVVATAGATNTTGTAANLSGTPALPNGTTATTQTAADNTTKIATDAFVATAVAGAGPAGANPTGTVGLSAVNGSATTFLRSDGAPPLSQSISPTWTGTHTFNGTVAGTALSTYLASPPAIGGTAAAAGNFTTVGTTGALTTTLTGQTPNTQVVGGELLNNTAASASNQQEICQQLSGQGWKTTATAASEQVDWQICNVPVQGGGFPESNLTYYYQVSGGGYNSAFSLQATASGTTYNSNLSGTATAGAFAVNNSTVPSNGVYRPATNTVGIAANTTEAVAVTSTAVTLQSGVALSTPSTVSFSGLASSSAAATGTVCWTTGGNLTVDTTLACLSSTARIKQDIEPLDEGLATVMALRPVSYDLKPEYDPKGLGPQVGLIAEDVQKVDPRLIGLDTQGHPLGVRYMQLTAVLVKAIQDQQREINQLKRELHKGH